MTDSPTRIMALDIGSKRTGVALSDETRLFASPLLTLEETQIKPWLVKVQKLVEEHEVAEVLVGLPLNQFGEEGKDALNIRRYIAALQEGLKIPVIEWDERFTTVQAERTLIDADLSRKNRKKVIDQIAACIMLQGYLDSLKFNQNLETSSWDDD
ncbi:MAG: Holliday junction resolvase RuvX [Proteobacteria bacterium]|jgi:putative Holliday junction resolvase|nr:Holliday junction resolvase RuvX [Pseudomonadota bacterium]